MKIALMSDLHGSLNDLKTFIECVNKIGVDKIYCLGDVLYHGPRNNLPQSYSPKDVAELFNEIKEKTVFIRGNCDARIDEMVLGVTMYDILEENYFNHHFVFSHGDILDKLNFNITSNTIICTGHTHVHNIRFHKNILFLNPGSLSMPKKETVQSFMIIDEQGVYLHNLKNEIISTFKFNK